MDTFASKLLYIRSLTHSPDSRDTMSGFLHRGPAAQHLNFVLPHALRTTVCTLHISNKTRSSEPPQDTGRSLSVPADGLLGTTALRRPTILQDTTPTSLRLLGWRISNTSARREMATFISPGRESLTAMAPTVLLYHKHLKFARGKSIKLQPSKETCTLTEEGGFARFSFCIP